MAGTSDHDKALMARAAEQIDHAASTIAGLRRDLAGHHSAIMAGWTGSAANQFNITFQAFDEVMGKILSDPRDGHDGLEQIHEKLVGNRIQYESAEQEQTDAVNSIHQFINN